MGMLLRRHRGADSTQSAPVIPEAEVVEKKVNEYTKSEISFMKADETRALAKKLCIEGADELSSNKLKPLIIKKLGL